MNQRKRLISWLKDRKSLLKVFQVPRSQIGTAASLVGRGILEKRGDKALDFTLAVPDGLLFIGGHNLEETEAIVRGDGAKARLTKAVSRLSGGAK